MADEVLTIQCPCCSATLGFDEVGDPYVVEQPELPSNTIRGLGGLEVVEADERWLTDRYLGGHHQGINLRGVRPDGTTLSGEELLKLLNPAAAPAPIEIDSTLTELNAADLKTRGITN